MKEALRHLEYALKFGVEQNLLTPYILARLRMQRPAGFYNLYEHELIESDAKLEFVRAKLAEYRCITTRGNLLASLPADDTQQRAVSD